MKLPLYWLLPLILTTGACLKRTPQSTPSHNFGDLIGSAPHSELWYTTEPRVLALLLGIKEPIYPAGHPKVVRLEEWLDVMDQAVRSHSPALPAPKPKVLLVANREMNAAVSAIPICAPTDLRVVGASQGAQNHGTLLTTPRGQAQVQAIPFDKCIPTRKPRDFVRLSIEKNLGVPAECLELGGSTAAGRLEGSLTIDKNPRCADPGLKNLLQGMTSIKEVRSHAIVDVITVHDKIFDLAEEEALAILAHELAHYYRFHAIANPADYGFFYQMDQKHNLRQKPAPLSPDHPIAKLGAEAITQSPQLVSAAPVPGQKYHSLVFASLRANPSSVFMGCGGDAPCISTCESLARHFALSQTMQETLVGGFPLISPLPKSNVATEYYRSYEQKAEACFTKMKLGDAGKLWFSTVFFPLIPIRDKATPINYALYSHMGQLMGDMTVKLDQMITKNNQRVIETLRKANADRVGVYTDEQEADELGLEIAARIGLSAETFVRGILAAIKLTPEPPLEMLGLPGDLRGTACEQAYAKGFPDFIPLARYGSTHPSPCFRVYNAYREAVAHADELKALKPSSSLNLQPALWQTLRRTPL